MPKTKPQPTKSRRRASQAAKTPGEDRFAPFEELRPDQVPWASMLHRSERVDWDAVKVRVDAGLVVTFHNVDESDLHNWTAELFKQLGRRNVDYLYIDEYPGRLFVMSKTTAKAMTLDQLETG